MWFSLELNCTIYPMVTFDIARGSLTVLQGVPKKVNRSSKVTYFTDTQFILANYTLEYQL